MSISVLHLRELVIRPTLKILHEHIPYSEAAEELLLGTAAQETHLGYWLAQIDGEGSPTGPGLGLYSMEWKTYEDIFHNFLRYRPALRNTVLGFATGGLSYPDPNELCWNLHFATVLARVHYYRVPSVIPTLLKDQAEYWKEHYNTHKGAGTVEDYIHNYNRYVKRGDGR